MCTANNNISNHARPPWHGGMAWRHTAGILWKPGKPRNQPMLLIACYRKPVGNIHHGKQILHNWSATSPYGSDLLLLSHNILECMYMRPRVPVLQYMMMYVYRHRTGTHTPHTHTHGIFFSIPVPRYCIAILQYTCTYTYTKGE